MQQQQEEQGPKSLRNVHLRQWEGNSKMTMLLAKASLGGMYERKKGPQGNRAPHGFVPRPRDPALRSSLLEFWQRPAAHLEERTHVGLWGWTRLSFHLPQWLERGTEWGEWGRGRGRWLWGGEKSRGRVNHKLWGQRKITLKTRPTGSQEVARQHPVIIHLNSNQFWFTGTSAVWRDRWLRQYIPAYLSRWLN